MAKGPPTNFARDARGDVINGLLMQKDKDRRVCGIDRYYSITANGRRRYLGNSPSRIAAVVTGLWYLVGGLTCGRYFLSAGDTDQNLFAYVTTAIYAVGGLLPGM